MCAGGEAEPRRARGKVYAGMDELRYGKEDREDEAEGLSKIILYCALIWLSSRCLSQLLYYDLLGTVNYSALKQKLILLLII